MTGPLPTHYKMGCFLLLPTHYSPTMPPQSERSSSHIPHHSKSCPYKMRGFLPNTYNRGWHCCSIFLSFSQAYNLRLWTVQNSSGFWHPSMVPSKKMQTHTQNNKFSSWVVDAFWIYYKMGILNLLHPNRFGCFKMLKAPQSQLFVYKMGPISWLKTASENQSDQKNRLQPITRPIFGTHFVENQPWVEGPEPAFCREIFQATPFCRWSWVIL